MSSIWAIRGRWANPYDVVVISGDEERLRYNVVVVEVSVSGITTRRVGAAMNATSRKGSMSRG